jgi:hypothetical protein
LFSLSRSFYLSLFLSVSFFAYMPACLSLSLYVCLSLSVCVSLSLSVCVSLSPSLPVSISVVSLSLFASLVCLSLCLLYLSISLCLSVSLSLSLFIFRCLCLGFKMFLSPPSLSASPKHLEHYPEFTYSYLTLNSTKSKQF